MPVNETLLETNSSVGRTLFNVNLSSAEAV